MRVNTSVAEATGMFGIPSTSPPGTPWIVPLTVTSGLSRSDVMGGVVLRLTVSEPVASPCVGAALDVVYLHDPGCRSSDAVPSAAVTPVTGVADELTRDAEIVTPASGTPESAAATASTAGRALAASSICGTVVGWPMGSDSVAEVTST